MARLAFSVVWDETVAFVRREGALILPVGFATFGIGLLLSSLGGPAAPPGAIPSVASLLWQLPMLVLAPIGWLAISAMTLRAGLSVSEALRLAFARLGTAILATGFIFAGLMLLFISCALIMLLIGIVAGWGQQQIATMLTALMVGPIVWLSVRLIALCPLLVSRNLAAGELIRESFRVTRGHALQITGVVVLNALALLLAVGLVEVAAGSLFLLIGSIVGSATLGVTLTNIAVAAVVSVISTVWTVFVALLYRRMAAL
jgi:hypothetical protein